MNLQQISECYPDHMPPHPPLPDHSSHHQQEPSADRDEGSCQGHSAGKGHTVKIVISYSTGNFYEHEGILIIY